MNPNTPQPSREEIEVRLTALLLGELPEDEAALLRWALTNDAELAKLHDRLKHAMELTREAVSQPTEPASSNASAPLKLSDARREQLFARFKTLAPREFKAPQQPGISRLIAVAAAVAIIALLAAMLLPALSSAKSRAQRAYIINNLRLLDIAKEQWASENNKTAGDVATLDDIRPYFKGEIPSVAGESYVVGRVGDSPVAEVPANKAKTMGSLAHNTVINGKVEFSLNTGALGSRPPGERGAYGATPKQSDDVLHGVTVSTPVQVYMGPVPAEKALSQNVVGYVPVSTTDFDVVAASASPTPETTGFSPGTTVTTWSGRVDWPVSTATNLFAATSKDNFDADWSAMMQLRQGLADGSRQQASTSEEYRWSLDSNSSYPPFTGGSAGEVATGRTYPVTNHLSYNEKSFQPVLESVVPAVVQSRLNEYAGDYDVLATNLAVLHGMSHEKLRVVLPRTAYPDPQLMSLLDQLNVAEQKLLQTKGDFRPNPPLEQAVQELSAKVDQRVDGILAQEDKRLADLKQMVAQNRTQLAEINADQNRMEETRPYYEAKAKLQRMQHFQSVLEMKLLSTQTDAKLPMTAVAQMIEPAKPQAAVSPNLWERLTGDSGVKTTARIKVSRTASDIGGLETAQAGGYDPYFIQTEFEIIKSDDVLDRVVKALKLDESWSKNGARLDASAARELLKKHLELAPVRNTTLIDISVRADDATESARLANAVAEAYSEKRKEDYDKLQNRGVAALKDDYADQEKQIADTAAEVERLRQFYHIGEQVNTNGEPTNVIPHRSSTNAPIPQPEVQTRENPFSTFSLNVSDVSFKLAATSLENGRLPDPASIRSEEFINAFDYHDPEASGGSPVAFAWERARYPFEQNRDLLRFSIKTAARGRQTGRPLNLVLLLDNSGSMDRPDRVGIIREALRILAAQLQPQDKLSIITFARTPQLRIDGVSGTEAGEAVGRVSGLTPEGGTNLEAAMNLAYQTALHHFLADGVNRVVLLTDGAANLGDVDPESLKRKVESFRKQGVALDCFGIGWEGLNDDLLEVLTRNGDGRYGFINTPEEATSGFASQLAGALQIAASDVKVQVEFNPQRVISYRQIGYAKHQLTKEQFRDNTVDAAEIAAQEAGNALYTIETNPSGEGPVATIHLRYKTPGTTEYHEQEWAVPYTGNSLSPEQSSVAMRLAATASAFSEWLATSPFAQEVSPDQLLHILNGVPEAYSADARPKKLEWMIRQANSLQGK